MHSSAFESKFYHNSITINTNQTASLGLIKYYSFDVISMFFKKIIVEKIAIINHAELCS